MDQIKANLLSQTLEMTYTQDSDCCTTEEQYLTIKTDNGGGGDFYVIETKRWAFDTVEEIIELLEQFKEKHLKIKDETL
jgi:hypothetical protein